MALTLPYSFDTRRVVRLILRGVVGFELLVIVPGIVFAVVASRGLPAIGILAFSGASILVFGWIVVRFLAAASGTITAESVVVEPMTFCGVTFPGLSGTFPISSFRAVRVERVSGRTDTMPMTDPTTRVYLVGQGGTSDLLIARAGVDEGFALGRDLGAALRLPCESASAPY